MIGKYNLQQLETCNHNNPEDFSCNTLMIVKIQCLLVHYDIPCVKQNGKGILNFCNTKKCFVTVFRASQAMCDAFPF